MKRKISNHELNIKHANDIKCLGCCSSLLLMRQLKTIVTSSSSWILCNCRNEKEAMCNKNNSSCSHKLDNRCVITACWVTQSAIKSVCLSWSPRFQKSLKIALASAPDSLGVHLFRQQLLGRPQNSPAGTALPQELRYGFHFQDSSLFCVYFGWIQFLTSRICFKPPYSADFSVVFKCALTE